MDTLLLKLTVDDLPQQFKYEIVYCDEEMTIIRSNLKSMDDINQWVFDFGEMTNTRWISRNSDPHGERFVCWKKFICYRAPYKKRLSVKNTDCDAFLYIKVKRNIPDVIIEDPYIQLGLPAEIRIKNQHTHDVVGDVIRYRRNRMNQDLKYKFFEYFNAGLGVRESWRYHQRMLLKEYSPQELALCELFPSERAVRYWRELWRQINFKPGQTSYQSRFDTHLIKESLSAACDNNLLETLDPQDQERETIDDVIDLLRTHDAQYGSSAAGLRTMKHELLTINSHDSWETFLRSPGSRRHGVSTFAVTKKNGNPASSSLSTSDFSQHRFKESEDLESSSSAQSAENRMRASRIDVRSEQSSALGCEVNEDQPVSLSAVPDSAEESGDEESTPCDVLDEEGDSSDPEGHLSKRIKGVRQSRIPVSRKSASTGRQYCLDRDQPVGIVSRNVRCKKRATQQLCAMDISHLIRTKQETDFHLSEISVPDEDVEDTGATLSSPIKKVMKAKKSFTSKQTVFKERLKVNALVDRKRAYVIKV